MVHTLADVRALVATLAPLTDVAAEFQRKWSLRRAELLAPRQAEIERGFAEQSAAELRDIEAEVEAEGQGRAALAARGDRLGDACLREVFASVVRGRSGDADGAFEAAAARGQDWADREEAVLVGAWEASVARFVRKAHELDEDELTAWEQEHVARREILAARVAERQRSLEVCRDGFGKQLAEAARAIGTDAVEGSGEGFDQATSRSVGGPLEQASGYGTAAARAHGAAAVEALDVRVAADVQRCEAIAAVGAEAVAQLQARLQQGLSEVAAAAADEETRDLWQATRQKGLANEAISLGAKLRAVQAALAKPDWQRPLAELSERAGIALRQTESAIAVGTAGARLLPPSPSNHPDVETTDVREAAAMIAKHPEVYAQSVSDELTRTRNAKVGLVRTRAVHLQDVAAKHDWETIELEDDLLPAVSRLAHEVETLREAVFAAECCAVGASRRAPPPGVSASAYRRALSAALPVVRRLWEGAGVLEEDRWDFVSRLCDALVLEQGAAATLGTRRGSAAPTLEAGHAPKSTSVAQRQLPEVPSLPLPMGHDDSLRALFVRGARRSI